MRSARTPYRAFPFLMVLCALAAVSVPEAAAQSSPPVLYACYAPNSGSVYRIKEPNTPAECSSKQHVEFSWNHGGPQGPHGPVGPEGLQGPQGSQGPVGIQGPVGPEGSQGPKGPAGPQGPEGAAGPVGSVSGWEVVTSQAITIAGLELLTMQVLRCPAGKHAFSGGLQSNHNSVDIIKLGTLPPYQGREGGIMVDVYNYDVASHTFKLHVICGVAP